MTSGLQLHPKIQHPYILISGDGDDSSPGEYRSYIDDPKCDERMEFVREEQWLAAC